MATFSQELHRLFADMSLTSALLISVGFMLLTVEFFQSSRGLIAVCGLLAAISGMVVRMIGGGTPGTMFLLFLLFAVCVYAVHVVMLASFKRDWLMQSAYMNVRHVDIDRPLVGLTGTVTSDIDGYGRVMAEGLDLFVQSDEPIRAGASVRVARVSGDKIFVKKIEE